MQTSWQNFPANYNENNEPLFATIQISLIKQVTSYLDKNTLAPIFFPPQQNAYARSTGKQ